MFKHLQKLDQTLFNLEVAGLMIAPLKSQFYVLAIKVVSYVCDIEGWHPETVKVIKILDWPACMDAHAAWSFIRVVVYYQQWIRNFAIIAAPIYQLLQKNNKFHWKEEEQAAIDKLKICITSAPVLTAIQYPERLPDGTMIEVGTIVVTTNASYQGQGGSLNQEVVGIKKR